MKPKAPAGFRGDVDPIGRSLPGVKVCESDANGRKIDKCPVVPSGIAIRSRAADN